MKLYQIVFRSLVTYLCLLAVVPPTFAESPSDTVLPLSETRVRLAWPWSDTITEMDDELAVDLRPDEATGSALKNAEVVFRANGPRSNSWLSRFFSVSGNRAKTPIHLVANRRIFGGNLRTRFDYGEFDNTTQIHGQLMMPLFGQFGLDASGTYWEDDGRPPRLMDDWWTGDANVVYNLSFAPVNLRFGGGTTWVITDADTDFGYNITYGADFFIKKSFLFSGEFDWGKIGSRDLVHWRATGGYVFGAIELYAGYASYKLGSEKRDGPIAGAGIVF